MYMDEEFIAYDLDWFLVLNDGFLAHLATGGTGPVPENVKSSIENYERIYNYFHSLDYSSAVDVIEENTPNFPSEEQRSRFLTSFIAMSGKGLFSYDYRDGEYKLVSKPKKPIAYDFLPEYIKNIIHKDCSVKY